MLMRKVVVFLQQPFLSQIADRYVRQIEKFSRFVAHCFHPLRKCGIRSLKFAIAWRMFVAQVAWYNGRIIARKERGR